MLLSYQKWSLKPIMQLPYGKPHFTSDSLPKASVCQSFWAFFLSSLPQLTCLSAPSHPRPTAQAFFCVLKVLSPDHCMMASSRHLGLSANASVQIPPQRGLPWLSCLMCIHRCYCHIFSFYFLHSTLYYFPLVFYGATGKKRIHKNPDWLSCSLLYLQGLE